MGIAGLLPFLEAAKRPCHISEFRGATVAVDTYCWLHKGATICPIQLIQGENTTQHIDYCLKYVKMLKAFDIRPILVFDGQNLPAKANTESKRRESRSKARQRGAELLRLGKTQEARSFLKQAVNITPEMALALIKECRKIDVDCIVAPYESDAQLAFFNLKGIAEIIITEDSDLVLFGCTKVLYKLDQQGNGILVEAEKIPRAMKIQPDRYSFDKFRHMCIISGCDYVDSLSGIGLKKAHKFIKLTDETNPEVFLSRIPKYLKMHHLQVTEEYKENFMKADATFRHQIVFDPFKKKLVPLTDPQECGTNPKYCSNAGEAYDDETAFQVAIGNLHPSTFKKLDDWYPRQANFTSIWSGCYKKSISRKEQKQQDKPILNHFSIKTKAKISTEIDDVTLQIQDDERIKKELEFYYHIPQAPVEQELKEEEVIEEHKDAEAEIVSPVLTMNPFVKKAKIRSEEKLNNHSADLEKSSDKNETVPFKINLFKKKLSKFPRTPVETNNIVVSRYFVSDEQNVDLEKCEMDDSQETDLENTSLSANVVTTTAIVHINETQNKSTTNSPEADENINVENEDCSINHDRQSDNSVICRRKHSEILIDLTDDSIEQKNCTSESPQKIQNGLIIKQNRIKMSSSSPKHSPSLKRKLETCRMISRKKPRSQHQITDFFKKM